MALGAQENLFCTTSTAEVVQYAVLRDECKVGVYTVQYYKAPTVRTEIKVRTYSYSEKLIYSLDFDSNYTSKSHTYYSRRTMSSRKFCSRFHKAQLSHDLYTREKVMHQDKLVVR